MKDYFLDCCLLGTVNLSGAEIDFSTAPVIRETVAMMAKNEIYEFTLPDEDYFSTVF